MKIKKKRKSIDIITLFKRTKKQKTITEPVKLTEQIIASGKQEVMIIQKELDVVKPLADRYSIPQNLNIKPSCFSKLERFSIVRDHLDSWMAYIKQPQPEHLELIQQYIVQLINHKNLEDVATLLRHLQHVKQEKEYWQLPCEQITHCTQNIVKERYGATIKL